LSCSAAPVGTSTPATPTVTVRMRDDESGFPRPKGSGGAPA
jgi:hypothetical protein